MTVQEAAALLRRKDKILILTHRRPDGDTMGCAAGLCVNAGLGFVVLFRNVRAWRRNLALWGVLFVIGAAAGYAVQAVMLLF